MKCLSCSKVVTWQRPIVYIGYNRAIHVDEFVKYMKSHSFIKLESDREAVVNEIPEE